MVKFDSIPSKIIVVVHLFWIGGSRRILRGGPGIQQKHATGIQLTFLTTGGAMSPTGLSGSGLFRFSVDLSGFAGFLWSLEFLHALSAFSSPGRRFGLQITAVGVSWYAPMTFRLLAAPTSSSV